MKETPTNIIVRMPNWLGDLVMATPVLKDLRSTFPKASITAMCQKNACSLISRDPNIDEIICFKKPSGWIHRRTHFEIIDPIRKGGYDLGILLTNSISSAWWFWRGRVGYRLGFSNGIRNLLLSKSTAFPKNVESQHLVLTYKSLLEPLGVPPSDSSPQLYLTDKEIDDAKQLLSRYGVDLSKHTVVGINPGAAYGSAKCWLPDRFEGVTKKLLQDPNAYVLYFGDNNGAPLVNKICRGFSERVINLAAKTSIRELMALIKLCSVFLTNDSGPMHIAAALQTPLVALFGSTSDVKTGPYPKGKVIHKHVECSPCYKRVCPIDFRCMKRIEVEEVYNELIKKLEESEQKTSV